MNIFQNPAPQQWSELCRRAEQDNSLVAERVETIVERVREQGDEALLSLAEEIDGVQLSALEVSREEFMQAEREVSVTQSLPAEFKVEMNESLAATLVTNLIKNAFVHSSNGSEVHISIAGRMLTISNAGEEPLDKEHIFERFYQADGSHRMEGNGLGLACAFFAIQTGY